MILGGQWDQNAGSYGLPPRSPFLAKRIPEAIDRLTGLFLEKKENGEKFQDFIKRIGKKEIKGLIKDLTEVPAYEEAPELYVDWGDAREYTIGDIGIGECAGELVETADFGVAEGERLVFEAQVELDEGLCGP